MQITEHLGDPDEEIMSINANPSPSSLSSKEDLDAYISSVNSRLSTPTPVTKEEVESIHERISSPEAFEFCHEHVLDSSHPLSLILALKSFYESGKSTSLADLFGGLLGINESLILYSKEEKPLWIFKPQSGEAESHVEGIAKGESAKREALASSLNVRGVFPIPRTILGCVGDEIGSFQQYKEGYENLSRLVTDHQRRSALLPLIASRPIQASLIFDIIYNNADRHLGNLMFNKENDVIMIDHGLCLSQSPNDPMKLEQISLPQLHQDWDRALVEAIDFNLVEEKVILQSFGLSEDSISRSLRASQFIKKAISLKLKPYDAALLSIKLYDAFWDEKRFNLLIDLMEEIPELKQQNFNTTPKIIKSRKTFAFNHAKFDDLMVSCLFGAQRGDTTPGYILWQESILGTNQLSKEVASSADSSS